MGHFEEFFIDRSEGWKYQTTLENADGVRARVWVDDDGNISKDSYSREYNKKNSSSDKPRKEKNRDKKSSKGSEKNESFLKKVIKAPFRFLWWLVKFLLRNSLNILTFGILRGWFDKKD